MQAGKRLTTEEQRDRDGERTIWIRYGPERLAVNADTRELLVRILHDGGEPLTTRETAAELLAVWFHDPEPLFAIAPLSTTPESLQIALMRCLVRTQQATARVQRMLTQALQNGTVFVRMTAASALGNLRPVASEAVTALSAAASDPEPLVRREVAIGLLRVAEQDSSVLPAIVDLLADPVLRVSPESRRWLQTHGAERISEVVTVMQTIGNLENRRRGVGPTPVRKFEMQSEAGWELLPKTLATCMQTPIAPDA